MIAVLGTLVTAWAVSVFVFPILIKYSQKKNILDVPGHRRIHKRITPSIGGVAIFLGFLTTVVIWLDFIAWPELKTIIGVLMLTFLVGLCDDLVHIKPTVKLAGQAIAGSVAFLALDIKITSLYGFFGHYEFPMLLSYFVTIAVIILLINSYNLIDGLDGLAGTVAMVCLLFFGIWFKLIGDIEFALLCFSLIGAVLAFLVFNWEPSKIFMGDTGALLIGMMLSILVIRFINLNSALPHDAPFKFQATISTAIAVLFIPVVDTTRIIIIRLSKGISPLKADKRHIHHCLVRLGLHHWQAVLVLLAVHCMAIGIALVFRETNDVYLFFIIAAMAIGFSMTLGRFVLKKIN